MEFTAENLEKVVTLFYRSEAGQQAQAHEWLTEAQKCPQAWTFVWQLLQPNRSSEVQFFAATTLHTKILRFWHEVPVDQYEALKQKILDAILAYAMGPKIVLNRLCITLAAYILNTIPHYWPNAFNELLNSFQPQHLPNIQPERVVWVLLEILTLIPEEFQSMSLSQSQRVGVKSELHKASKDVLTAMEAYMSTIMTNSTACQNDVDLTTYLNAARCVNAWFYFGGLTLEDCDRVITYMLEICDKCYWKSASLEDGLSSDETDVMEATLEAISTIIAHPQAHKYPTLVSLQLDKVLNKLVKILHAERNKTDADMNIQVSIYSLIIVCAETHSKLLIQNLLKKNTREYQLSLWIIQAVLMCTDTPGVNPIDEECSNLTFGFWYLLQDEVLSSDHSVSSTLVAIVKPFYRELITIFLRKSMLPQTDDDPKWTEENKEILRCHRQDIADTMMYSYEILEADLLNILNAKLFEALQLCDTENDCKSAENWPYVEACLYAYFAIAEHFESEEIAHLTQLMQILTTKIPYMKLNIRVLATALDILGAYANWINEHPFVLPNVVRLLLLGLQNPEVGINTTMALKDITRECQLHISPYAVQILQATRVALEERQLRMMETIRLMYSVGKVLSVLPIENIMEYLNLILSPIIEEFQKLIVQNQYTIASKSSLIMKLRIFGMLFSTLDTSTKDNGNNPISENNPQPTLLVMQKLMPLFIQLASERYDDVEIMEELYSTLKHGITTLLDHSKPIVNEVLQLLVASYRIKPLSSALEISKHLLIMFGKDPEYSETMHLLLCEIINVTLQLTSQQPLSDIADVLEAFFIFLALLFKKSPELLCRDGINIVALFQCAILCLSLPEQPTVKNAANFLIKFIGQSRESEILLNTIHTCGESLLIKVMLCIGGEAMRNSLDVFTDILLALNKKYCDYLARWFAVSFAQPGFPSRIPTQAQKEQFVKNVLRTNRNKRKLQDLVKEFSLVCRGLVVNYE